MYCALTSYSTFIIIIIKLQTESLYYYLKYSAESDIWITVNVKNITEELTTNEHQVSKLETFSVEQLQLNQVRSEHV